MSSLTPTVLVVTNDATELSHVKKILEAAQFQVVSAQTSSNALDAVYASPPQCVLLDNAEPGDGVPPLLIALKSDNVYGHTATILMVTEARLNSGIDWSIVPADDYVVKPFSASELVSRVQICIARNQRDIDANPLTGLPGNLSIMREAECRLSAGKSFALAYLDLDNFKSFNDKYGFSRGDEVLRMTARILVNAIRALNDPDTHVGHIGGDDFVFMIPSHLEAKACRRIIEDFDCIVPNFYDEEDRKAGILHSVDRQGHEQVFPIMSISIAVVDTSSIEVKHLADISARAAEVKHFTKQLSGSNYIVDRRKQKADGKPGGGDTSLLTGITTR